MNLKKANNVKAKRKKKKAKSDRHEEGILRLRKLSEGITILNRPTGSRNRMK